MKVSEWKEKTTTLKSILVCSGCEILEMRGLPDNANDDDNISRYVHPIVKISDNFALRGQSDIDSATNEFCDPYAWCVIQKNADGTFDTFPAASLDVHIPKGRLGTVVRQLQMAEDRIAQAFKTYASIKTLANKLNSAADEYLNNFQVIPAAEDKAKKYDDLMLIRQAEEMLTSGVLKSTRGE